MATERTMTYAIAADEAWRLVCGFADFTLEELRECHLQQRDEAQNTVVLDVVIPAFRDGPASPTGGYGDQDHHTLTIRVTPLGTDSCRCVATVVARKAYGEHARHLEANMLDTYVGALDQLVADMPEAPVIHQRYSCRPDDLWPVVTSLAETLVESSGYWLETLDEHAQLARVDSGASPAIDAGERHHATFSLRDDAGQTCSVTVDVEMLERFASARQRIHAAGRWAASYGGMIDQLTEDLLGIARPTPPPPPEASAALPVRPAAAHTVKPYAEESFRTRLWLMGSAIASAVIGGYAFTLGSAWPLAGILAIAAGIAAFIATGGGSYWRPIPTKHKLAALPGLIIGSIVMVAIIFVGVAAWEAIKAEFKA